MVMMPVSLWLFSVDIVHTCLINFCVFFVSFLYKHPSLVNNIIKTVLQYVLLYYPNLV